MNSCEYSIFHSSARLYRSPTPAKTHLDFLTYIPTTYLRLPLPPFPLKPRVSNPTPVPQYNEKIRIFDIWKTVYLFDGGRCLLGGIHALFIILCSLSWFRFSFRFVLSFFSAVFDGEFASPPTRKEWARPRLDGRLVTSQVMGGEGWVTSRRKAGVSVFFFRIHVKRVFENWY
ncbi:hypothetical protein JTE90_014947 [Oedothorax gibbosus]|uniref:Transmembrane protein n=1 Tax=Oedothorax gibbosus TaxID=931172 RepID=A0AAV6UYZ8_9ARAC|nr:hypothetical protein JTE90_014947 [Oedothorax gibbosus]